MEAIELRKRFFMAQCLRWHPDKNVDNKTMAKEIFQLLQEKKAWFLA
jgi:gamma-glutamyl-gamma-aminobutyrate hydrolase PuuD